MTPTPLRRQYPSSARRRFGPATGLVATALTVALTGAGCAALTGDTGADELDHFLDELSRGNLPAAVELTTNPAAAEEQLVASMEGMGMPTISATTAGGDRPDRDPVAVEITWDMGAPGGDDGTGDDDEVGSDPAGGTPAAETAPRTVTTTGEARTTKIGDDWKVEWAPTILDTRLAPGGTLAFAEVLDYDTNILDRTGEPLMQWTPVTAVTLAPEAVESADAVAALVSAAAPTITGQSIRDGMAEAGDQPYQVVALRPEDIEPIREQLAAIAGVNLPEQGQLIRTDRGLDAPVLDGLPSAWMEALQGVGGWSAEIVNPDAEPIELGSAPAGQVDDLVSTLQISMQRAAQQAVDGSALGASIVAIQPSTGGILAVAQNSAADQQGPVSMQGRFPPGSTFKIVTTAAALEAGVVGPDEVVPCPASVTVSGRTIPNDDDFELGPVPLETAFARSCNTSQAVISDRLTPEAMKDTAAKLGLGVGFFAPGLGLDAFTGSVPVTEQGPARVEAAIGQGEVLASPFGMAVMTASLANGGRMILPHVVDGMPADANDAPEPLDPGVVDTLRRYMEQTVRSGTATAANSIPGLGGKTGTAEVGTGPSHGWFVGSTGDIALAVLVEGADSSGPAVAMAADFLGAAGQPAPLAGG
ncbi:penicillin-binding transpeptidase domain-containing protein [Dietzia psychralcaliphila]|uniref:Penicillin-binding protein n=1 Tax=Dietzia psychralcaliphila TaxID=139021 RepID=A0AAD0NNI7_9ACTN|nr:penicillin-binding transpeptidase domain-containing protein [Dietzia psychralcaliphila]AWH96745.1 penicillin-binding protein [Dietzia psychralcaliphila]PTM89384.1 cell division protein FtsI/penicillin-binding protein 2 [Dietzia psychralcaliphila]